MHVFLVLHALLSLFPVGKISLVIDYLRHFVHKLENPEINLLNALSKTLSVTEQLARLSDGINLLDKELQSQVLDKHEDLVSQATWVEKLQGVLSIMHIHVQSLLSSVERVRVKVIDPFNQLETQTLVLSRLHDTTDLLRRASRIQQLAKKLPGPDPLRAAHILSELDELYKDVDLSDLDILEAEQKKIKKETVAVEKEAVKIVELGLASLDIDRVAVGVEIMVNRGTADVEIQKIMDSCLGKVDRSIQNALDMDNLVPVTTRGGAGRVAGVNIPNNIQNFRNKLWSSWESVLNSTVYSACAQMAVIQKVLNDSKVAGFRDGGLRSSSDDKSEVAHVFWTQVDDTLNRHLVQAAQGSSYMKQALEGEYPKLLRLHLDLHKKLKLLNPTETNAKPIFPNMGKCVKQFETAYLSRSVMLILDAVREMFPEASDSSSSSTGVVSSSSSLSSSIATPVTLSPSTDQVDALIKTISSELSVSLVDEALTLPVAKNVTKGISLFCQKSEQMVNTSSEAAQVIELPNAAQKLNVDIANIVYYMCEQVKSVVNNLGLNKSVAASVHAALAGGENLTQQILNPLLASVLVAIESIILTIHNEDFNIQEYSGSVSLYMKELHSFTARAVATYLAPYQNQKQVTNSCTEVASRAVEFFLRHATLLRPLSEAGRRKIVADFKSFEDAIAPLCVQLSELGAVYSTLRSIRPLITAPVDEVTSSPVLGQVIPYSLVVTLLFSRGPPELPSPHQSVGWPVSKLSEWLDNHTSERDRLELLTGALKKYEQSVCNQNRASFHDIYPAIKSLMEKATNSAFIKNS